MGRTYKQEKAARQWRHGLTDMVTNPLRTSAALGTSRESLREMLAEAAANTAVIKTDEEPRTA
jgi:hypothetical protein